MAFFDFKTPRPICRPEIRDPANLHPALRHSTNAKKALDARCSLFAASSFQLLYTEFIVILIKVFKRVYFMGIVPP